MKTRNCIRCDKRIRLNKRLCYFYCLKCTKEVAREFELMAMEAT